MKSVNTLDKTFNILKNIKQNVVIISKGEYNFKILIYVWGLIPAFILTIFFQKKINHINNEIMNTILCIFIIVYFLWHTISIRKTLKVHPENKVIKQSKKDLYKNKTKTEIREIKKGKRKEKFQKALLLKGWDSSPDYVLISCFNIYVILTQIQRLLIIFD